MIRFFRCSQKEPAVTIALRLSNGRVEVRQVKRVGEMFRARLHASLPDTEMRVLPHGKVSGGPSYVYGWDPVSPIDWQPDGAETAHETIQRLEAENKRLTTRFNRAMDRLRRIVDVASRPEDADQFPNRSAKPRAE